MSGVERARDLDTEVFGGRPVRRSAPAKKRIPSAQARRRAAERRRKKRLKRLIIAYGILFLGICTIIGGVVLAVKAIRGEETKEEEVVTGEKNAVENIAQAIGLEPKEADMDYVSVELAKWGISCEQDFIPVNEYSRPGDELKKVKNIFVHYTANPGTSAAQNRSYFANLAVTGETSASAHFVIGYEGEVIQCIPLDEMAYAVIGRNEDSISIECCYLDEDGRFTQETYDTLTRFLALMLNEYGLDITDVKRHYDEGGKLCPKYYVKHEDSWQKLLKDVQSLKETY